MRHQRLHADADQPWRDHRRRDRIGRRGRHAHAEDDRHHHGEDHREEDRRAGDVEQHGREAPAHAGQPDDARHDARRGADRDQLHHFLGGSGQRAFDRDQRFPDRADDSGRQRLALQRHAVDQRGGHHDDDGRRNADGRRAEGRIARQQHGDQQHQRRRHIGTPPDIDPARQLVPPQAADAGLARVQVAMDVVGDVEQQRRDQAGECDLGVGHAQHLGHDEGARAHHRRGDLPTGGARRLHRRRRISVVADAAHHRDGEGARRHDIRDRGAGDGAEQKARDDSDLGRAAARPPDQRQGQIVEIVARLRRLQEGREGDEQDDEAGRDLHDGPEHAVIAEQLDRRPLPIDPTVIEDAGHPGADEAIGDEDQRDDRHDEARRAAGEFQHQQDAGDADHQILPIRPHEGPHLDPVGVQDVVQRDQQAGDHQQPVVPGHPVAGGAAGAGGEQREAQRGAEEHMQGAGDGGIDRHDQQDPHVPQHEGRGRGPPAPSLPPHEVAPGGGEFHVVHGGVDRLGRLLAGPRWHGCHDVSPQRPAPDGAPLTQR